MSAKGWAGVALAAVADDGNLTQLYPASCPTGEDPTTATPGQWVREPIGGELIGLQVQTDDTNGGVLELYDMSGALAGADVSSATTITNAQLTAALANGTAELIYRQNLVASGETPPGPGYCRFLRGLVGRFSNDGPTGNCYLNLRVSGGYRLVNGTVRS